MIFLCKKVDFLCCTHRNDSIMHSPVHDQPNLVFSAQKRLDFAQETANFTNVKKIFRTFLTHVGIIGIISPLTLY